MHRGLATAVCRLLEHVLMTCTGARYGQQHKTQAGQGSAHNEQKSE